MDSHTQDNVPGALEQITSSTSDSVSDDQTSTSPEPNVPGSPRNTTVSHEHTSDTLPQPSNPLEPDVPPCGICLEELSTNIAILVPCQHKFDLPCVRRCLEMSGSRGRQCPLCRTRIEEFRHSFTDDGTYSTEVPGPARSESPLASGPDIEYDEELRDGMTAEERGRVLELRRLRRALEFERSFHIKSRDFIDFNTEAEIRVSRRIELKIEQANEFTNYELSRELQYKCSLATWTSRVKLPVPPPGHKQQVEQAKNEIDKVTRQITIQGPWATVLIQGPRVRLASDQNGLRVILEKMTLLSKKSRGNTVITTVKQIIRLYEKYQPLAPRMRLDPMLFESYQRVRRAREDIQGVIIVLSLGYQRRFRGLQRSTTGVLPTNAAAALLEECEYCGKMERNGNCLYPVDVLKEFVNGRITAEVFRGWTAVSSGRFEGVADPYYSTDEDELNVP